LEPCWLQEFDMYVAICWFIFVHSHKLFVCLICFFLCYTLFFSLLKPESKELCLKVYDEDRKKGSSSHSHSHSSFFSFTLKISHTHTFIVSFFENYIYLVKFIWSYFDNIIDQLLDDFIGQVLIDIDSLKVCQIPTKILWLLFHYLLFHRFKFWEFDVCIWLMWVIVLLRMAQLMSNG
jgi:hypothetical protein